MSLQKGLEKTENFFRKKNRQGGSKKSSKLYKKFRNKFLRLFNKEEIPPTKMRRDWEY